MSTLTYITNGYTENTPRIEGTKETQRQEYLQRETRENSGVPEKRKRDRIIVIENSHTFQKSFVIEEVGSVQEVVEQICIRIPQICVHMVGMRISSKGMGCVGREYFDHDLPYDVQTLYITLYLKKHTPSYMG